MRPGNMRPGEMRERGIVKRELPGGDFSGAELSGGDLTGGEMSGGELSGGELLRRPCVGQRLRLTGLVTLIPPDLSVESSLRSAPPGVSGVGSL